MAWDEGEPAAGIAAKLVDNRVRTNNSALETALDREHEFDTGGTVTDQCHHRQGSARPFFQDSAPTTRVDGTAFTSEDNGSLWVDTNSTPDNQLNILTDYTGPTWTPVSTEVIAALLASARIFLSTLRVTGNFDVNTNKFTVNATSGNTLVAGKLDVTGNFDPTTFETTNGGFLDEDDMASDSASKVASQQSIKAYVDGQVDTKNFGDSATDDDESNAMVVSHAYLANQDGYVQVQCNASAGAAMNSQLYVGSTTDPYGAGTKVAEMRRGYVLTNDDMCYGFFVPSGKYFEVRAGGCTVSIRFQSLNGTLVKPTDNN